MTMQITALVKSVDHVCCRYRLAAYRPFLEAAGHRLKLVPWPGGWFADYRLPPRVGPADVLIVQRRLLSAWQLSQVRGLASRLIYDVDDAVFVRDSFAARGLYSERRLRGFARMVKAADTVVVGNAFLAEQAALWTPPERVRLISTRLVPERYPIAGHDSKRPTRLVWIGSSGTLRSLERIANLLDALGARVPGLSVRIICDRSLRLGHTPVDFRPWSEETEAQELAECDIGIGWLPDDLWSRGKCGLKILQYMAAGLPVIANPVGVHEVLVRHGETGFLARTSAHWVEAVATLAANPDLRRRMGEAGRRSVERHYHLRQGAAEWLALLAAQRHAQRDEAPAPASRR